MPVMAKIANKLSLNPALAICGMVTSPLENTTALGPVATGSIKAQLADIASGTNNIIGSSPDATASAPMIGRSVAVVAVLLVSSVRKTTNVTRIKIIKIKSNVPIIASSLPIQIARPDDFTAAARLKPPPKRSKTPHGIFSAVFQSSKVGVFLSLEPDGTININIAPAMAMSASLSQGSISRLF